MNRINQLFEKKQNNILSVYFTAGHPTLDSTAHIIHELEKNGVDLIEVGMPFSDPIADGPVIQKSSFQALENGMSINLLFEQLADIRKSVKIPLILMGYINPVMQYGIENFCKKCTAVGIDGLILPDLPMDVYLDEYKEVFEKHGIINIFLIAPQTSDERMKQIDTETRGFIYMVSSSSTTGAKASIAHAQVDYFKRVNSLGLKSNKIIGFGISNKETFKNACKHANGAIIGSAFVNSVDRLTNKDLPFAVKNFIDDIIIRD